MSSYNINKKQLGIRIKSIRTKQGDTLQTFAERLGTVKSGVFAWEKGNSIPHIKTLKNIALIGNKTVNELLYGSVEEFVSENYFLLNDKYKNLSKEELKEKISSTPRLALVNTITSVIRRLREQGHTVNDIDKLTSAFNDIVNNTEDNSDDFIPFKSMNISVLARKIGTDNAIKLIDGLFTPKYSIQTEEDLKKHGDLKIQITPVGYPYFDKKQDDNIEEK